MSFHDNFPRANLKMCAFTFLINFFFNTAVGAYLEGALTSFRV